MAPAAMDNAIAENEFISFSGPGGTLAPPFPAFHLMP
jgi:hypothetical protein